MWAFSESCSTRLAGLRLTKLTKNNLKSLTGGDQKNVAQRHAITWVSFKEETRLDLALRVLATSCGGIVRLFCARRRTTSCQGRHRHQQKGQFLLSIRISSPPRCMNQLFSALASYLLHMQRDSVTWRFWPFHFPASWATLQMPS